MKQYHNSRNRAVPGMYSLEDMSTWEDVIKSLDDPDIKNDGALRSLATRLSKFSDSTPTLIEATSSSFMWVVRPNRALTICDDKMHRLDINSSAYDVVNDPSAILIKEWIDWVNGAQE